MPTTQTLSKSQVRRLALDVRRASVQVQDIVTAVDTARKQDYYQGTPGDSLREALRHYPAGLTRIHDALGVIDGVSAQLRELLEVGD